MIHDDVECMDDEEILEALYEFSSQASCLEDQEVTSLVEDEINQELDDDIHVFSHNINEDMQHICKLFSDHECPSNYVSNLLFPESMYQKSICEDQVSENTCT